jgi:hypothetical protein
MTIPSRYFHNRSILLLLIINTILLVVGIVLILFRIDSSRGSNYIVEYRANSGIDQYRVGTSSDIFSFIAFLLINAIIFTLISLRTFGIRRHVAVMCLVLSALLSLLCIIVSNALLAIR